MSHVPHMYCGMNKSNQWYFDICTHMHTLPSTFHSSHPSVSRHLTALHSALCNEWVMSLIWMSHAPHILEPCPGYLWVRSHTWMSHVTQAGWSSIVVCDMTESCHMYVWATSRTWISHVQRPTVQIDVNTHVNSATYTYMHVHKNATECVYKHATQCIHLNVYKHTHIHT